MKPGVLGLALACIGLSAAALAAEIPRSASPATASANKAFGAALNLADKQDFDDATRGLVAKMPDALVKDAKGETVWDGNQFGFIQGDAPDSFNPSLWRQEKLNNTKGRTLAAPKATLSITHPAFFKMPLAGVPLPALLEAAEAKVDGDPRALGAIFANLDKFDPLFNIVTP